MLGLKRYKNCTLDLWVGLEQEFFCDLMVFFRKKEHTQNLDARNCLEYGNKSEMIHVISKLNLDLKKLSQKEKNLRHLGFVFDETNLTILKDELPVFINWIRDQIQEDILPQSTKRITLISSSVETHDMIQQELSCYF